MTEDTAPLTGAVRIVNEDIIEQVSELQHIRQQSSQLRQREAELRASILEELGDGEVAVAASGMPVAHLEIQNRSKVNTNKLRAKYPDVYEDVYSETVAKILRVDLD